MAAIWLTPAGNLGIIPELEYYDLPLDAYSPTGGPLTFKIISGSLPEGLEIYDDGRILGIPVLGQIRGVPEAISRVTTSEFTVRITDTDNKVTDRTFSLTVAGLTPPVIVPETADLGTYIDGTYVDIKLDALEANSLLTATFSLLNGELPPGLTLTPEGRIYGYIRPTPSEQTDDNTGFDASPFDVYGFDFSGVNISRNYQFTVQADDNVNTDAQTYNIFVYARTNLTADNDIVTVDLDNLITADLTTTYNPVILTDAGEINSVRQNTRYAYQIKAEDFDFDEITYEVVSGSLPTGLSLHPTSGWITGIVPFGSLGSVNYSFGIRVYKTNNPTYTSETKTFTIKVLGQIDDTVIWETPGDLGTIFNGSISELFVSASTTSGRSLRYNLVSIGALPIGLELLSDGTIAGRVSFETWSLDGNTITFDNDLTTFDQSYTFTIAASDSGNFVYDTKEFTVKVIRRDIQPYENLYIQALPNRSQRSIYDSVLNNSDIIPTESIYRQWDPWFGKNTLRRVLFLSGLNPRQVADYISAMQLNHYWKTLNFGQVKTAKATDVNFNTIYEVVYLELIDNGVNDEGFGPNLAISWPPNTEGVGTVYPNSFTNMSTRITDNIGYENRSILPKWMTSRQDDGTVLGFTRALVLVYTKPGKSAEIAYRVNQEIDKFSLIDFTIDRYEWDSILSNNFLKAPAQGTGLITAATTSNLALGSGTVFSTELLEGKTVYVSNSAIGNINTISNNTVLTFDANSLSNVTSSSFTYSTNVFIVNNFVYGSGNISATTSSNIITGISTLISGNGVISGNTESTTIIGIGTAFNSQLRIGKNMYYLGNSIGTITSIKSATELTLSGVLSANLANVSYTADGTTTLFAEELHVGDTILAPGNVILGTVKTINSNTNLVLYSNSLSTVSDVAYLRTDRDPYTSPTLGDQYLKFPQVNILS